MTRRFLAATLAVAAALALTGCATAGSSASSGTATSSGTAAPIAPSASASPTPSTRASGSSGMGLQPAVRLGASVDLAGPIGTLTTVHRAALVPGPLWMISDAAPTASSVVIVWTDIGCARVRSADVVETDTAIIIDLVKQTGPQAQACPATALRRLGRVRLDAPVGTRTLEEHVRVAAASN
jgi:hypothetical protein